LTFIVPFKVNRLINYYLQMERTIILAVIPCNQVYPSMPADNFSRSSEKRTTPAPLCPPLSCAEAASSFVPDRHSHSCPTLRPQDIATVDILERAAVADPKGIRTIGVLTKPDLIGPGGEDEVLAVLHNVRKPLKLGCVTGCGGGGSCGEKRGRREE
jgi:hypothetical protein